MYIFTVYGLRIFEYQKKHPAGPETLLVKAPFSKNWAWSWRERHGLFYPKMNPESEIQNLLLSWIQYSLSKDKPRMV